MGHTHLDPNLNSVKSAIALLITCILPPEIRPVSWATEGRHFPCLNSMVCPISLLAQPSIQMSSVICSMGNKMDTSYSSTKCDEHRQCTQAAGRRLMWTTQDGGETDEGSAE